LVTLARFGWLADADLARCRLEACGIEAFLPDEHMDSLCWHYAILLGGVPLQVRPEDEEDARAILAEEPEAVEPLLTDRERASQRAILIAVTMVLPSLLLFAVGMAG
jgi:hypothetical protein